QRLPGDSAPGRSTSVVFKCSVSAYKSGARTSGSNFRNLDADVVFTVAALPPATALPPAFLTTVAGNRSPLISDSTLPAAPASQHFLFVLPPSEITDSGL